RRSRPPRSRYAWGGSSPVRATEHPGVSRAGACDITRPHDEIGQAFDELGVVVERRHHLKLLDADLLRLLARLNVYFIKGLDVFCDEGDRDHEQSLSPLQRQGAYRVAQRRLQP